MTTHSKEVSFSVLSVLMICLAIILLTMSFGGNFQAQHLSMNTPGNIINLI